MKARLSLIVLIAFVLVSAACSDTELPTFQPTPILPVTPAGPSLSGPSRSFSFSSELSYPVQEYTKRSSFILFDSGAFRLDYSSGSHRGRYTEANGTIVFQWDENSGGVWGATGTINADLLTVRYNLTMQLNDFDDAVYKRTQ